jgi:hypothetical protein
MHPSRDVNDQPPRHPLLRKFDTDPESLDGGDYNDLLSLFRHGTIPLDELRPFLRHPATEVVLGGLFIAEELHSKATPVLDLVIETLARDGDRRIRWQAYVTIEAIVSDEHCEPFWHLIAGLRDADSDCRKLCMFFLTRAPMNHLRAGVERLGYEAGAEQLLPPVHEFIRHLEAGGDMKTWQAWLVDPDPIRRRLAAVAIGRTMRPGDVSLASTIVSDEQDIRGFVALRIQFLEIRERYERRIAARLQPNSEVHAARSTAKAPGRAPDR